MFPLDWKLNTILLNVSHAGSDISEGPVQYPLANLAIHQPAENMLGFYDEGKNDFDVEGNFDLSNTLFNQWDFLYCCLNKGVSNRFILPAQNSATSPLISNTASEDKCSIYKILVAYFKLEASPDLELTSMRRDGSYLAMIETLFVVLCSPPQCSALQYMRRS